MENNSIESDPLSVFKKNLHESKRPLLCGSFEKTKNHSIELDCADLQSKIKHNLDAIIFIEGNFAPGDIDRAYPTNLIEILHLVRNPKVCLLPDLLAYRPQPVSTLGWGMRPDIGFEQIVVDWANHQYATQKFGFLQTFP